MTHLADCGFQNTTISGEDAFNLALQGDPLLAYASEAWAFHVRAGMGVEETKHQAARFIRGCNAFPAFTQLEVGVRCFDIVSSLHLVALYHLPVALVEDAVIDNPNALSRMLNWLGAARSPRSWWLQRKDRHSS
jgi:hypothetical protein